MWISYWFVLFIVFSCLGWIYETTYCTIKGKKWENRGFLYGPLCPIYGAGCVACMALYQFFVNHGIDYKWWQVFLAGYLGSIILEFSTHWILEKLFHAYWWDYSYMPFNIQGRVCLPYSIAFGVAAVLIVFGMCPHVVHIAAKITPIVYELLSLIMMLVLGMDIALTVAALSDFEEYVASAEESVNTHMESFVEGIGEKYGQMSETVSAKFSEEKEKFSKERIMSGVKSINSFRRRAIERVQGFRPRKNEGIARNRVLQALKEYRRKDK